MNFSIIQTYKDSSILPGSELAALSPLFGEKGSFPLVPVEFIVGYKPGANGRSGKVGSVEVAVTDEKGAPLAVASLGNLDEELQDAMSAEDGSLKQEWYGVCVEWLAQGLNKNGRARHAHLVRIRPDKTPQDCTKDQLSVFARV